MRVTITCSMKLRSIVWLVVVSLTFLRSASGQVFQNLDFESANLSPIPAGQFGGEVPITDAIPGWTGYLGTAQVSQVLQNDYTLGAASLDILGPNWSLSGIIDGQYTVVLQPGAGSSGVTVGVSISQTGLIPTSTESLFFKAQPNSGATTLLVSLGGQNVSFSAISTGPNYTLYGGNISAFAGQAEQLTITAVANAGNLWYIDDIQFSPSSVPEPSTLGLIALGGLLFGLRRSN
jgi:hypothetical protein